MTNSRRIAYLDEIRAYIYYVMQVRRTASRFTSLDHIGNSEGVEGNNLASSMNTCLKANIGFEKRLLPVSVCNTNLLKISHSVKDF